MGIYVEVLIHASMDALWQHTQEPARHQEWDLRFSRIDYLPRHSETGPQRFRYATRIGFGLEVAGEGESVGERNLDDGSRTSALAFWSADPRSLIHEGSGYWKYIPATDGVTFLTWYDYRTRFGLIGKLVDRSLFRPLIGWATAWSFDRLRLWVEEGVHPAQAARHWLVHAIARVGLASIFAYQGVVPKLVVSDPDELAMLRNVGVASEQAIAVAQGLGVAELIFAICLLAFWSRRWPSALTVGLMVAAAIGVAVGSPEYLVRAFNPLTLNLAVASLAAIDLVVLDRVPSAARCRRRPRASA